MLDPRAASYLVEIWRQTQFFTPDKAGWMDGWSDEWMDDYLNSIVNYGRLRLRSLSFLDLCSVQSILYKAS